MAIGDFVSSLQGNQYFSAGFGLAGVGAAMFAMRGLTGGIVMLFRRHCITTLELSSKDRSYEWMLQWLGSRPNASHHIGVSSLVMKSDDGRMRPSFNTFPSTGQHFIWYNNKYVRIERNREKKALDIFETITLQTFGKKQFFVDMLTEAAKYALTKEEGKTVIYFPYGSEWRQFGNPRSKRVVTSVVLDEGLKDDLLEDIDEFMASQTWYAERGIPYRRGYLLHGPPGTGKTSFITSVAGELDYGISMINLADTMLSDDRLYHLMAVSPQNSIILLEDIDVACSGRDFESQNQSAYRGMGKLSLSGLLNALDGVMSSEGRLVFMTTNYYEKLHPALLRPGRVDVKALLDNASFFQLARMFARFHQESTEEECEQFARSVEASGGRYSPAQVQAYLMRFRDDCQAALSNAKDIGALCS